MVMTLEGTDKSIVSFLNININILEKNAEKPNRAFKSRNPPKIPDW